MFDATPSTAAVYTDFVGLAALRARAGHDPRKALTEAARQFEAYFIQQLLKAARQAGMGGGLLDGEQSGFYREMYHQQLAITLARTGAFGVARMIERQVAPGLSGPAPAASAPRPPAGHPRQANGPAQATPSARRIEPARDSGPTEGPEGFVRRLWPHARRAAARLGVDPGILVAQAALETGWGRAMPRTTDGRASHNLFGIKAHGGWRGPTAPVASLEFEGGAMVPRRAEFRVYRSPGESFEDYVRFLRGNPRYADALRRAGDPEAFVRGLQEAGYATDPRYADKVLAIYRMPQVQRWVAQDRAAPADKLV